MIRTVFYLFKRKIRGYLECWPHAFLTMHHLWFGNASRAVSRDSDLVVEGFPRSANSFVHAALSKANPDLKLAHHLHSAANVIAGVQMGKPTVVLLRKPRDAVLSFVALHIQANFEAGLSQRYSPWMMRALLSQALDEYHKFYTSVSVVRDRILLITFDEVTRDFGPVVERINARFGLSLLPFEHSQENESQLFAEGGFHLSPSEFRERVKRDTSTELDHPSLAPKLRCAEAAYVALLPAEPAPLVEQKRPAASCERQFGTTVH